MGQLSKYGDDEFLYLSPTEIVARVAASDPTLAQVSAMAVTEQIRIGWLGNPAVEKLYDLGNTGVWAARAAGVNSPEREGNYNTGLVAARLLSGANSVAVLLDNTITALGVANGHLAALAACIDTNRLKTIETP